MKRVQTVKFVVMYFKNDYHTHGKINSEKRLPKKQSSVSVA